MYILVVAAIFLLRVNNLIMQHQTLSRARTTQILVTLAFSHGIFPTYFVSWAFNYDCVTKIFYLFSLFELRSLFHSNLTCNRQ